MTRRNLTALAQEILEQYLHPGDCAIDATAGNGHDSCFLAQQVGSHGQVFSFDIQQAALESTFDKLQTRELAQQVRLIHRGHEYLLDEIPESCHGEVQAVMFNLGYLPGGNKRITTIGSTTLPALEQAAALLAPNGIITVLAYRGHPGGQEEAHAVEAKLRTLAAEERPLSIIQSSGPVLFILAPHPHD